MVIKCTKNDLKLSWIDLKWSKNDLNLSKNDLNLSKLNLKLSKNDLKLSKNDPKWSKNDPKYYTLSLNVHFCSKNSFWFLVHFESKWRFLELKSYNLGWLTFYRLDFLDKKWTFSIVCLFMSYFGTNVPINYVYYIMYEEFQYYLF